MQRHGGGADSPGQRGRLLPGAVGHEYVGHARQLQRRGHRYADISRAEHQHRAPNQRPETGPG